jgi:hypothetical protein
MGFSISVVESWGLIRTLALGDNAIENLDPSFRLVGSRKSATYG